MSFESHSDKDTIGFGIKFSKSLQPSDVVACFGDLGTGKTCFIKGVCLGLGVREHVSSPSFTIVNEYNIRDLKVFHFDFYRVKSINEIREIGVEEYLNSNGISLIEWADRIKELLPHNRYDVHLDFGKDESTRIIKIDEIGGIAA